MGTPKKTKKYYHKIVFARDFPGGPVVKIPACAEDTGSIPGPGRDHMQQLSPCTGTAEPAGLEPIAHEERGQRDARTPLERSPCCPR